MTRRGPDARSSRRRLVESSHPLVPPLHVVAADEVLDRPDFVELAATLLRAGGGGVALHIRAHRRAGGRLFALGERLVPAAAAGGWLVLNDRVDVALALARAAGGAPADAPEDASRAPAAAAGGRLGVQLGARSLPVDAVRALAGREVCLGYSAHAPEEAGVAAADGADWLLLGTIYATPSHPGRAGAGPALVAETAARLEAQGPGKLPWPRPSLIAIGGVTPERVPELRAAGAHGVAVLRGIWSAPDPVGALDAYLEALRRAPESRG